MLMHHCQWFTVSTPRQRACVVPAARRGFTLIEILVVLFIIGLIVMTVTVNFAPRFGRANKATTLTHRITQTLSLMQDLAIFRHQAYGASLHNNTWRFTHWHASPPMWHRLDLSRLIRHAALESEFELRLTTAMHHKTPNTPQLIFYPNGEATPFTLEVFDRENKPYYRVQGDAVGKFTVTDLRRVE